MAATPPPPFSVFHSEPKAPLPPVNLDNLLHWAGLRTCVLHFKCWPRVASVEGVCVFTCFPRFRGLGTILPKLPYCHQSLVMGSFEGALTPIPPVYTELSPALSSFTGACAGVHFDLSGDKSAGDGLCLHF